MASMNSSVIVPLPVQSRASSISTSFTRPDNVTDYSIADVVGTDAATNILFAAASQITGGHILIQSASLRIDIAAIPAGISTIRLHLYNAAPTAITDNLAYNLIAADRAKYLGFIEFDTPVDLGDTLWTQKDSLAIKKMLVTKGLYGVLQTLTAYTPSAEDVYTVTLDVLEV